MPTHAQRKVLRYTPEEMDALVADVRRYPEFLPWCTMANILQEDEAKLVADMTIGFKMFRETFRSEVTLERPSEVRVTYLNGPFRYLNNPWKFLPHPAGCEVDFYVAFVFPMSILPASVGLVFLFFFFVFPPPVSPSLLSFPSFRCVYDTVLGPLLLA